MSEQVLPPWKPGGKGLEEYLEYQEKRVAELERKINLLAERVVHYYNHTTPEIDGIKSKIDMLSGRVSDQHGFLMELKEQIAALEKRVHDLEYKGAPLYYERGRDE